MSVFDNDRSEGFNFFRSCVFFFISLGSVGEVGGNKGLC